MNCPNPATPCLAAVGEGEKCCLPDMPAVQVVLGRLGQPVEPFADQGAAALKRCPEFGQVRAAAPQPGQGGQLRNARRADHRQIVDFHDLTADRFRQDHIPGSPTTHRVCF